MDTKKVSCEFVDHLAWQTELKKRPHQMLGCVCHLDARTRNEVRLKIKCVKCHCALFFSAGSTLCNSD
jgi:hypothetical protein